MDYAERFSDWHRTPIAAYFSHYEPDTPYKRYWWELAESRVDIAICTARQYLNMVRCPRKVLAVPPVDPQFAIRPLPGGDRPVIGVAGFVDRSGRKGEHLVARLARDLEGKAILTGTGDGWPVPTRLRKFGELPEWYNNLDVFLCTSLIEGIPMPPLEALACGVPVVIPRGVGMLDDLIGEGIYRYQAGDYDSMRHALDMALSEDYDREAIRASVASCTPEAWAASVAAALQQKAVQGVIIESDRHGQRGVCFNPSIGIQGVQTQPGARLCAQTYQQFQSLNWDTGGSNARRMIQTCLGQKVSIPQLGYRGFKRPWRPPLWRP